MFESSKSNPVAAATLTAAFDEFKTTRWKDAPEWLNTIRNDGRRLFDKLGLPHRRIEEWKYTDISTSDLGKLKFSPAQPTGGSTTISTQQLERYLLTGTAPSPRLVFVNGYYSPELSAVKELPAGVEAGGLGEALKAGHPQVKKHLGNYAIPDDNSLVALNNAYVEDGAFIYVPADVTVSQPLHLIYLQTGGDAGNQEHWLVHPRNLMVLEEGASLTVMEEYVGEKDSVYFSAPVTELVAGDRATAVHYKLQRESESAFHIATLQTQQGEASRIESHSVSFGAKLTRNDIHSHMSGPDSHCTLNGLFMIRERQHVDNHTLIYHGYPDCTSSELYHGILDNQSRGVFNGKIFVEPEAQQTDSRQTNRTLMLSSDARMDAKPQLEIFADDVKCTHGATVGRIDEDSLYYLRSRGISQEDARKMLTLAFGQQVTQHIRHQPLREAVEDFIASHLRENTIQNS